MTDRLRGLPMVAALTLVGLLSLPSSAPVGASGAAQSQFNAAHIYVRFSAPFSKAGAVGTNTTTQWGCGPANVSGTLNSFNATNGVAVIDANASVVACGTLHGGSGFDEYDAMVGEQRLVFTPNASFYALATANWSLQLLINLTTQGGWHHDRAIGRVSLMIQVHDVTGKSWYRHTLLIWKKMIKVVGARTGSSGGLLWGVTDMVSTRTVLSFTAGHRYSIESFLLVSLSATTNLAHRGKLISATVLTGPAGNRLNSVEIS